MTNFLKFSRYRAAKSDGYEPLVALQRIGSTDSVLENEGAKAHVAVASVEVDTGAQLVAGNDYEVDLMETRRIREKIDWHILPLMCTLYWIQFMDKTTLGSAAILGIREASHLTTNQYNWYVSSVRATSLIVIHLSGWGQYFT
ncbi:hypothetical protein AcV7_003280 [Taiwanofungus camphoratus]|nr:hypothetical protein AcV7_003280 [Antrodia cinnamomea]